MKRQMKIAAVVSATALLAIGASITSMAAAKNGSWQNEDGVWYCYDKDGDVYENVFCLDGSEEFYVGDDGAIVYSEWADIDGDMYYIDSKGQAAKNCWKLLVPHNDEDADPEWYFFQASGKMAKDKKVVYEGNTYYFDQDGSVIYGWVDSNLNNTTGKYYQATTMSTNVIFTDEETGARVSKDWVNTYEPGTTDEEKEDDDTKTYDYYIKSNSKVQFGKANNIDGETFFFDANGKLLKGWIATTGSNNDKYEEIGVENQGTDLATYVNTNGRKVYFSCEVDGHAKKDKWILEWNNKQYAAEDTDNTKKHFWVEKDGTVFVPKTASLSNATKKAFADAEHNLALDTDPNATNPNVSFETKKIDSKYYAFNQNGEMLKGIYEMTSGADTGKVFYFNADGEKTSGSVSVTDEYGVEGKMLFSTASTDKYVGIDGAKNGKLYNDGLLVVAKDAKYEVVTIDIAGNNHTFIVNKSGSIQTTQKEYKDGDDLIKDAKTATFADSTVPAIKGSVTAW